MSWPVAPLSGIARLRALEVGLPGAFLHERRIAAPLAEVWGVATDFEHAVPIFDSDVSDLRILSRDGDRVELRATGPSWMLRRGWHVTAEVHPGWCLMVTRPQLYVVAMAAEPDGDGTRFGHLEGLVLPQSGWKRRLVQPVLAVSRWRHRHHVPHDVDGIERLLGLR